MKKDIIPILILLLLAILGISGCTDQPPDNKTYSTNGVTFKYPGNWAELNKTKYQEIDFGNESEIILALGNDQTRFTFGKAVPGENHVLNTLPGWAEGAKSRLSSMGFQFLSEKNLTLAGVDAYQLRFIDDDGDYYTGIAFIKNNTGYLMVYVSVLNETETLEDILRSFQMA